MGRTVPLAIEKGHKVRHPKTLGRDRADRGTLGPRTATETAVPESEGTLPTPVWVPGAATDVPTAF